MYQQHSNTFHFVSPRAILPLQFWKSVFLPPTQYFGHRSECKSNKTIRETRRRQNGSGERAGGVGGEGGCSVFAHNWYTGTYNNLR